MDRLAIIADNLVGANDAGIQFKKNGLSAQVVINHNDIAECCGDAEIISVNTDSRKVSPGEAYERVYKTGKKLMDLGFKRFYKKIDSTLRGNIAEEIKAMMNSLAIGTAIITPAYPVHGRIVENGYLELVQNWGGGSVPVPICHIPPIIKPNPNTPVAVLTLADVREGDASLLQRVTDLVDSGVSLIVTDAVTDEDLQIIAITIASLDIPVLAAGSAGLAGGLSNVWAASSAEPFNLRQGTMIITGTLNQATAEQINEVKSLDNVKLIAIKSGLIYEHKSEEEFARVVLEVKTALAAGKVPAIIIDTLLENRDDIQALSLSVQVQKFGFLINSLLGRIAEEITATCRLRTLVISGDGTTASICGALKIQRINLVRELLPGIALGKAADGNASGLYLVTKAGGFGERSSFRKTLEML